MQVQWTGQRDERRRRVLLEELPPPAVENEVDGETTRARPTPGPLYAPAALPENHPRVGDYIPRRPWTLALAIAGLLLGAGLLALAHAHRARFEPWIGRENVAVFDLGAFRGLAAWSATCALLLAAMVSGQIYHVRRHKTTDYRGRYRLWCWVAALAVFASVDVIVGARQVASGLLAHVTGQLLGANGEGWWMLGYGLLGGLVALRMLCEVWTARLTVTALAATCLAYGLALAAPLAAPTAEHAALARGALALSGHALLLGTCLVHFRHVCLEAQGLLPPPQPRPAAAATVASPAEQPPAAKTTRVTRTRKKTETHEPTDAAPPSSEGDDAITTTRVDPPQALSGPKKKIATTEPAAANVTTQTPLKAKVEAAAKPPTETAAPTTKPAAATKPAPAQQPGGSPAGAASARTAAEKTSSGGASPSPTKTPTSANTQPADAAKVAPAKAAATKPTASAEEADNDGWDDWRQDDEDEDSGGGKRPLSKAERKKLRKQQKRGQAYDDDDEE